MKHLKTYEGVKILQYWKIHNNKDIKVSLFKLGMPFNEIDRFVSLMFSNPKAVNSNFIFIIVRNTYRRDIISKLSKNTQSKYGNLLSYSWSNTLHGYDNYTNLGEIVINQEDRDKYDIEVQSKKFNL